MAARRRRGEDGISFEHRGPCRDTERHRHCPGLWRGEITLEYTSDGKRARRRVSGKTRAAVVDKLRELHTDLRLGIVPKTGHANYTVRQAADDWLANGLADRSAKTIKDNQNMIEPILKVIGTRKLRELSAADVRQALSTMAAATAAIQRTAAELCPGDEGQDTQLAMVVTEVFAEPVPVAPLVGPPTLQISAEKIMARLYVRGLIR